MTTVTFTKTQKKVNVTAVKPRRITLSAETVAEIQQHRPTTAVQQRDTTVAIGVGGVQGPPGETEGATFNLPTDGPLSALRVVRSDNGIARVADPAIAAHGEQVVGISVTAVGAAGSVLVRNGGNLTDPGLLLLPGRVWCGAGGALTQTPPATGWLLPVGRVVDASTFTVDIEEPTYRS